MIRANKNFNVKSIHSSLGNYMNMYTTLIFHIRHLKCL